MCPLFRCPISCKSLSRQTQKASDTRGNNIYIQERRTILDMLFKLEGLVQHQSKAYQLEVRVHFLRSCS